MMDRFSDWFGETGVPIFILLIVLGAVLFLVVAILSSYQHATGIKAGYIYDKDYSSSRNYTTCSGGKVNICTPHHEDEKYTLWVRDGSKTNWVEVPSSIWDKAIIGQWFDSACYCMAAK